VLSFVTINVIATASFTVSDRTQMIAGLHIRLLSLVVWRKPSICRGNVLLDWLIVLSPITCLWHWL